MYHHHRFRNPSQFQSNPSLQKLYQLQTLNVVEKTGEKKVMIQFTFLRIFDLFKCESIQTFLHIHEIMANWFPKNDKTMDNSKDSSHHLYKL